MSILNQIKEEAKNFFKHSRGSHDWSHIERVYNRCMHIGKKENADLEILGIAALLHDIGRESQDKSKGKICHAEEGAILARNILGKYPLDNEKIDKITHCIETHRFRGNKIPQSKEAKILFDSDQLDSIGAIGIGKAFLFAGEHGAKLHDKNVDVEKAKDYSKEDTAYREYLVKLRKLKERMLTGEGRRIAEERDCFMKEFFERLNKEVDGEL